MKMRKNKARKVSGKGDRGFRVGKLGWKGDLTVKKGREKSVSCGANRAEERQVQRLKIRECPGGPRGGEMADEAQKVMDIF